MAVRQAESKSTVRERLKVLKLRYSVSHDRSESQIQKERTAIKANIELIRSLSKPQKERYFSRLAIEKRLEIEDHAWLVDYWACEESVEHFGRFCYTRDEHADGKESVKPFPTREELPYIWEFLDTVHREQILFCEKSRQMMVTWAMCIYVLWVCKFQENRLCFVQSKKEEDAANLVYNTDPYQARMSFIEWSLPDPLRSEVTCSYAKMRFTDTKSLAWAIPEGGEKIRSYTPSLLFSDEFAFQPEAEQAYAAARPAITGGGKFIAVSSARAGAYMERVIQR